MQVRLRQLAQRVPQRTLAWRSFFRHQYSNQANEGFLYIGDTYVAEGNFESAETCFAGAASSPDVSDSAKSIAFQRLSSVLLARAWLQNNDQTTLRRALQAAESALQQTPKDPLPIICKVVALARLGHVDIALAEIRSLLGRVDVALAPELRLQACALLVKYSALCGGTLLELELEVAKIRAPLCNKSMACDLLDVDHFGTLRLETEFLVCAVGVQQSEVGTRSNELIELLLEGVRFQTRGETDVSGDDCVVESGDREERRMSESFETLSELHEFTLSLVLPEPEALHFPLEINVMAHDQGALLLERLNFITHRADVEDDFEILWQALSWRCRVRMLQHEWKSAASDASRALMLNVFAAAELRDPFVEPCKPDVGVPTEGGSRILSTPAGLGSPWSCLRMRMVALHMLGRQEAARRDWDLLCCLQTPPLVANMLTPKLIRSCDDDWRRSPEQVSRLKQRQHHRRTGLCSLPKSV